MSVSIVVGTQDQLVRFSYLTVFEPKSNPFNPESGKMLYSLVAMVSKDDKEILTQLKTGIKKAVDEGIDKRRLSKKLISPYMKKLNGKTFPVTKRGEEFYVPVQDGDYFVEIEKKGKEFENHYFFNLSTETPPGLFDVARRELSSADKDDYFSGYYGRLVINLSAYSRPNQGIGFYLNKIQFVRAGERLDGGLSAEEAFGAFEDDASIEVDDNETDPFTTE